MKKIILLISILAVIICFTRCVNSDPCKGCDEMPEETDGTGLIVGLGQKTYHDNSYYTRYGIVDVITSEDHNILKIKHLNDTPIDFSKYSVLCMRSQGSGCDMRYMRDVSVDKESKKYTYTVTMLECGEYKVFLNPSDNIVIIPKIEDGYTVEIQLKEAYWIRHKIKYESLRRTFIFKEDTDGSWKLESETKY